MGNKGVRGGEEGRGKGEESGDGQLNSLLFTCLALFPAPLLQGACKQGY